MGRDQSTLDPASDAARTIETLWWILFGVSAVVVFVVTMLVVLAVLRRRNAEPEPGEPRRTKWLIIGGGAVVPAVVLVVLFAFTVGTMPATSASNGPAELRVDVIGHQWWWEVRYRKAGVETANEIHIPARTRVEFVVHTADVIHSFWVPQLHRKIDLIPGRDNSLVIEADAPGTYRGQCAEYCGLQHAHMALLVIAHEPDEFERWLAEQQRPARVTAGEGVDVFLDKGCGGCHAIDGIPEADGDVGPDLTHVADRRTLAAVTIPNRPGQLAGWIVDPQHVKPGNKMPPTPFEGRDLQSLLDFLEELE